MASRLRSVTLLRGVALRALTGDGPKPSTARPVLDEEANAILDYQGGLEHYHWDEAWRRSVIDHFEHNIRRMIVICQERDVPIWLVDPVSNLRDCPPFKSEHREGLTADELQQWDSLRLRAEKYYRTDMRKAIGYLEQASLIDNQYAGLFYDLAKCYDTMGMTKRAHEDYLKAKELDVCPLRILDPMNRALHRICRQRDVPLIPARSMFGQQSEDGIPGGDLLVDHVHPTALGHQAIAELSDGPVLFTGPGRTWYRMASCAG